MTTYRLAVALLVVGLCASGCRRDTMPDQQPLTEPTLETVHEPPERDEPADELPAPNDPSPELVAAVDRGEARPAGPVTETRYQNWLELANRRVDLEMQRGKEAHLMRLLELADRCEQQFLERFVQYGVHPGRSVDKQLQIFAAVRMRLRRELQETQTSIAALRQELQPEQSTLPMPVEVLVNSR